MARWLLLVHTRLKKLIFISKSAPSLHTVGKKLRGEKVRQHKHTIMYRSINIAVLLRLGE